MTNAPLARRLTRIEAHRGLPTNAAQATDAQLWAVIRSGYSALRTEHGSLAAAIDNLRTSGCPDDIGLADLIEEDTHALEH